MAKYKGVGAIITNPDRSLFFVQIKEDSYPIEKWQNCLSFWGGQVEETDFSIENALKREFLEEIPGAWLVLKEAEWKFIKKYLINSDEDFYLNVFEIVLPTEILLHLKSVVSYEGVPVILEREELLTHKWIWGLELIIAEYLDVLEGVRGHPVI